MDKSKKVIVTGGAGFLGQHLIPALGQHGFTDVFTVRSKEYDLLDREQIKKLYQEQKPSYVIHAAGTVGGIGANRDNPGRFFYENLMMGVQLMDEAQRYGLDKFVTIGTICSYPKHTPVPFKEENLWNGYPEETNAPYGLAKKMLLIQSQTYREQYGFRGIYLMPVNLYGPYDNFDLNSSHVIPAIIRKCLEAKEQNSPEIVCWGDGSPTREFLYAEDAAEGIALALENYDGSDPINLGANKEISIHDLVETIVTLTGYKGKVVWDTSKPNGQPRRCLDATKAKTAFGFQAKISLQEGLKKTYDWYLDSCKKIHDKPTLTK